MIVSSSLHANYVPIMPENYQELLKLTWEKCTVGAGEQSCRLESFFHICLTVELS